MNQVMQQAGLLPNNDAGNDDQASAQAPQSFINQLIQHASDRLRPQEEDDDDDLLQNLAGPSASLLSHSDDEDDEVVQQRAPTALVFPSHQLIDHHLGPISSRPRPTRTCSSSATRMATLPAPPRRRISSKLPSHAEDEAHQRFEAFIQLRTAGGAGAQQQRQVGQQPQEVSTRSAATSLATVPPAQPTTSAVQPQPDQQRVGNPALVADEAARDPQEADAATTDATPRADQDAEDAGGRNAASEDAGDDVDDVGDFGDDADAAAPAAAGDVDAAAPAAAGDVDDVADDVADDDAQQQPTPTRSRSKKDQGGNFPTRFSPRKIRGMSHKYGDTYYY